MAHLAGHPSIGDVLIDRGLDLDVVEAVLAADWERAGSLAAQRPSTRPRAGTHDFPVTWYPAIGGGSVDPAELLLEHGTDIEQQSGGEAALHQAAMRGQIDLVHYLLDRGADVRAVGHRQDRSGRTPLQIAVANEHRDVAAVLKACSPAARTRTTRTPANYPRSASR